jgi:hypothetical protein
VNTKPETIEQFSMRMNSKWKKLMIDAEKFEKLGIKKCRIETTVLGLNYKKFCEL